MLNVVEKALCRKTADMFEIAGNQHLDPEELIEKWLVSNTAFRIYDIDFNEIAQSPLHVLNSLLLEYDISHSEYHNSALMYWIGYMVTFMSFYFKVKPLELWENYDIIGFSKRYDTLHTLSAKVAAEECMEEFKK